MPARRLIAVTSGAYTSILATIFSRQVKIYEDGATGINGFKIKYPEDGFVAVHTGLPDQEPVILGNPVAAGEGRGPILGRPAQISTNVAVASYPATIPATTLCEIESLAAASNLWVEEYE